MTRVCTNEAVIRRSTDRIAVTQPLALGPTERREDRAGELVAAIVEDGPLGDSPPA